MVFDTPKTTSALFLLRELCDLHKTDVLPSSGEEIMLFILIAFRNLDSVIPRAMVWK